MPRLSKRRGRLRITNGEWEFGTRQHFGKRKYWRGKRIRAKVVEWELDSHSIGKKRLEFFLNPRTIPSDQGWGTQGCRGCGCTPTPGKIKGAFGRYYTKIIEILRHQGSRTPTPFEVPRHCFRWFCDGPRLYGRVICKGYCLLKFSLQRHLTFFHQNKPLT